MRGKQEGSRIATDDSISRGRFEIKPQDEVGK
jgi:hypothetical protein